MSLGLGTTAIVGARRSGVRQGRSGIGALGGRLNRVVPTPQDAPQQPFANARRSAESGGEHALDWSLPDG